MSPDATAFAHLVDDGGYPRAVQRLLRGRRASSSRDVELPVVGPVTKVVHSADDHWLACQVAPEGCVRTQIWAVTTDPDDRMARRIDGMNSGTTELIAWAGAASIRVGPRGYRELIMLRGSTEIALLPSDPGSSTETAGEYVRALVRSDNGARHARLLEVTMTAGGVAYHVLAECDGHEITRRENDAVLASTVADWVRAACGPMFRKLSGG